MMTRSNLISRRRLLSLVTAGVGLSVASCAAVLGTEPPPDLFRLTPQSAFAPDLPQVDWQLLVEAPTSAGALNTERIAVMEGMVRQDYYAGVSWADRAPLMIQTLLVESFENSGRIISVGRDSLGLRGDYVLKTELREFQAETRGQGVPPQIRVRLTSRLVRFPERQIIASDSFEQLETAGSTRFDAIVAGFDVALGKVIQHTVAWTLREGERDWQEDPRRR